MFTLDRWMGLMPDYYRDIREFEELMKTLGEEARLLEIEKERLLNNQFVLSSDEGAIKRRETELGIQSDPNQESLDFRKKRIINRYSTKPPFTIRYLQERLDYLIGRGRANASVDPQDFVLKVRTKINDASVFREVEHTVHSIKPANLVYHQETSLQDGIGIGEHIYMTPIRRLTKLGSWKVGRTPFAERGKEVLVK
ncbi:putative phage tail protein [Paenibacillus larvae]|uniref:putative phage tail protein n=1 Tax=Paenibacillus larvae TaxID=1464 RepID=UPI001F393859|nr:putative phage tail protein [Paenibacillus larvae]MCY7518803.1 YmfQ family protein [Paenibacillus larvae]MCY9500260.1 YmfQ family protein [Paenibacillus larvae]MCY9679577.1 YmfQ family protein [Paenibacillus larvae]MCY9746620.1 YmfQ family protein [Paenibacillus larvae]